MINNHDPAELSERAPIACSSSVNEMALVLVSLLVPYSSVSWDSALYPADTCSRGRGEEERRVEWVGQSLLAKHLPSGRCIT